MIVAAIEHAQIFGHDRGSIVHHRIRPGLHLRERGARPWHGQKGAARVVEGVLGGTLGPTGFGIGKADRVGLEVDQ